MDYYSVVVWGMVAIASIAIVAIVSIMYRHKS